MTSLFLINHKVKGFLALPGRQSGSALVVAIFVIVVMALISVGLTAMIQDTSRNAAWEVLGTRAELAAYSGLEQALAELFPLNPDRPFYNCSDVTNELALGGAGFSSCSVEVICFEVRECKADNSGGIEELNNACFYELQATGQCGSGEVQVQRSQTIQARTGL